MLLLPTSVTLVKTPSSVGTTVFVVVNSILEVALLCMVGWILAHKGIVDEKAKKTLNKINVSLFTPALLFSKVAFSLSPSKLKDLFIIPVGFVIITAVSALIAWAMGHLFRLRKGQRNFAIACTMFQNSNSLPIALMQSLIGEKIPLKWGPHDDKDQMLGRALSYLVLYSTLGIIVRWSIGVRLLTSAETELEPEEESDTETNEATLYNDDHSHHNGGGQDRTPLIDSTRRRVKSKASGVSFNANDDVSPPTTSSETDTTVVGARPDHLRTPKGRKASSIIQSFPNTPIVSRYGSEAGDEAGDDSEDDDDDPEWGVRHGAGRRSDEDDAIFQGIWAVRWNKAKRVIKRVTAPLRRFGRAVNRFMTVPLWAALASIFVACVPPLQRLLMDAEPVRAAIKNAGNCSVPITLITLGAYFYRPSSPHAASRPLIARLNPFDRDPNPPPRPPSSKGETRTVLVAVISRMILVPLVMLPLFAWYAAVTVNVADDPVFVVTACLLIGSPTAITLAQITSSAAGDTFEKLISRTLFVSYAFLTAPTTIALVSAALFIDSIQ